VKHNTNEVKQKWLRPLHVSIRPNSVIRVYVKPLSEWSGNNLQVSVNQLHDMQWLNTLISLSHESPVVYFVCRSFSEPRKRRRSVFLPARRYASAVLAVIACMSVRLSVTSRCSTKTAKPMITQTGILIFWCQRSRRNSDGVTPNGGDKQTWGRFKLAIFDQYLRNGAR